MTQKLDDKPENNPPSTLNPPPSTLTIDRFGAFVGKHSERLRVSVKGEVLLERPFFGIEHILIVAGGVSLSSDVIRHCAEQGIQISFLTYSGRPYARLISPDLVGTVKTRREQLLAFLDRRGVELGKGFATGKLANQSALLKYMAKYRKVTDRDLYERVRTAADKIDDYAREMRDQAGDQIDDLRHPIMTLEAHAAKVYWEAARDLIIPEVDWKGRETRGAEDAVNSALNYGYGVLYSQTERAVILAGLDPFAGFLHVDRAGRPSMVLDMVEEFRQTVVDRSIFALLNKGTEIKVEEGRLDEASRRNIADRVNERLEGQEMYEGKKHRLRTIIQSQARHVAAFVRGERQAYRPFTTRW
ncbi:MAG: CRISPR-associated endonuclease Cas1 [Chloroflexi bacterium]|nr:CRISPR-associated endonuclease Cas1 [Chloroflexota bacterium]